MIQNEIYDLNENLKKMRTKRDSINDKIKRSTTNLSLFNKIFDLTYFSIKHELELQNKPTQAIGSVAFYNKLNENSIFYDEIKFNKIIRFLDHIEIKEKNYRDLYITCTNEYINTLDTIPINELKQEEKEINDCYKLLSVLLAEVNGDVVKFNKVYNSLEDAGLFMTVPEKKNLQYLGEISTKLDSVMEGLKAVFKSLEESNKNLREINQNTAEISYNTLGLYDELWDIKMNTLE